MKPFVQFQENNNSRFRSALPGKPYLIAGPCSAESENQVLDIARSLKTIGADLVRVGIWKPRSRPNSFEGLGQAALEWVKTAKTETGLPFATEIATPEHVNAALEAGIDVLWLGARTTVNPFLVQELAESLRGVDIPVMVKNPVNPDAALWLGGIERLAAVGIRQLAAVHRGFSTYEKTNFRNAPLWQIPIEIKRVYPNLPLFCDPSHITGNSGFVAEIAQRALDLGYDGLMIETHPDPTNALSDSGQQVTPAHLAEILGNLQIRKQYSADTEFVNQLVALRQQIDRTDHELIQVLAERMRLVEKIAEYKRENNVTVFQKERWAEIFSTRQSWAEKMGLYEAFIGELFQVIHQESIRKQTDIVDKQTASEK